MAEWSRVVATTIEKHLRGAEPAILRNRKLLAALQQKGRISFNHSGRSLTWRMEYRRQDATPYGDMDQVTFQRTDRHKVAELDWRSYNITDAVSKKEKLMNRGREQIVKLFSDQAEHLVEDINEYFHEQLYVDGNATGNENRIHGIESFMSNSGAGTTKIANPNDTYAGLVCTLGNYGGTWTGNWPDGSGSAQYDFWSPLILDMTDADWGASTDSWANNSIEILRFGIIALQRNSSKQGMLDLICLDRSMYRDFLDALDEKERINVMRDAKTSLMVSLGFTDTVMFDGVDVSWEYGHPASSHSTDTRIGYMYNFDKMELMSLQDRLFVPEGPIYDETRKLWRVSVDFFGNLKFVSPRYFGKILAVT